MNTWQASATSVGLTTLMIIIAVGFLAAGEVNPERLPEVRFNSQQAYEHCLNSHLEMQRSETDNRWHEIFKYCDNISTHYPNTSEVKL